MHSLADRLIVRQSIRSIDGLNGLHHGAMAAALCGVQPALNIHGTELIKLSESENL
jgi:hypothetical protein